MSRIGAALWREWESGNGPVLAFLRAAVLFCGAVFLAFTGVLPLTWPQQAVLALIILGVALWLDRSASYLVTLTLMLLSIYCTFRYAFWRLSSTTNYFRDSGLSHHRLELLLMGVLLLSECYAFVVLLLGYLQMVWPLRRTPVPLPEDTAEWPAVDVLIPTLNEPLEVVRFTALAAANMDWPADRLNVYILDDGRREEFRQFAEEAGIGYMTREDNRFAKAGNLNAALERVDSPFVVVFDADHVPTRSFLQMAMGWFLRDARLGILQTPHHFYSPDPFERNLRQFHTIPNEDELFYGIVQDGNDFWNATYFCGSCAVLRRAALDEAGGMAVETVTEDAHTSMRMQRLGWNSAYVNIPQAAGLATERLSEHVRQRIRWARGMVQILRIENPLFARGLTAAQRLCYFNSMSHFLYALPRLIFLTAPLMYLIFGYSTIAGGWATILVYVAPHLVLSSLTRSRIQGAHRHSFWTEIYETVLAPHLLLPTLFAFLRPRQGRFQVTPKGTVVNQEFFDGRVALPTLLLLSFNWFGLCCTLPRLFQFPAWHGPAWAARLLVWPSTLYDPTHRGTVAINAAWSIFNLVLLGVASAVAWESQQRRKSVRVQMELPSEVFLPDGSAVRGVTSDLSSGGVRTTLEYDLALRPGDTVQFVFPVLEDTAVLSATVVAMEGRVLRASFDHLNLEEIEALALLLYGRADRWLGWDDTREPDHPLSSLFRVLRIAIRGLLQTMFGSTREDRDPPRRGGWIPSVVPILTLALLAGFGERTVAGQSTLDHDPTALHSSSADPAQGTHRSTGASSIEPHGSSPTPASLRGGLMLQAESARVTGPNRATIAPTGSFHREIPLQEAAKSPALWSGSNSGTAPISRVIPFVLAQNELVKSATLHLRIRLAGAPIRAGDRLTVAINGTELRGQPTGASATQETPSSLSNFSVAGNSLSADLAISPDLFVRSNQVTIALVPGDAEACVQGRPRTGFEIEPDSMLELAGTLIPLQDELGLLPLPFYQPGLNASPVVQIAFLTQPGRRAAQAAAIVASWFGSLAPTTPMRFKASYGAIPSGDVVVFAERASDLPAALNLGAPAGPTLAMRTNPADPYGKLLVITGAGPDDLIAAARSVALSRGLQGAEIALALAPHGRTRAPDDAPRWLSTAADADNTFGNVGDLVNLDNDGTQPTLVTLHLPPDLYFGDAADGRARREVPLHLGYTYAGSSIAPGSQLEIWANGRLVRTLALAPTEQARTTVRDATVAIPVSALQPSSNVLGFRFLLVPRSGRSCPGVAASASGQGGSILKDSYLDIRGVPHWTELPNLRLFADAGFPFTRHADLSQTALSLPAQPSQQQIELTLDLLGHLGAHTGYPATGLTVIGPAPTEREGKDVLFLGAFADQAGSSGRLSVVRSGHSSSGLRAFGSRSLAAALPVRFTDSGLRPRESEGLEKLLSRLHLNWLPFANPASSEDLPKDPEAILESAEWPVGASHSAVLILARDDSAIPSLEDQLLAPADHFAISGNLATFDHGGFHSFYLPSQTYMEGRTTPLMSVAHLLSEMSWLVAIVSILSCLLIASLLRTMLRRGARARLQGSY